MPILGHSKVPLRISELKQTTFLLCSPVRKSTDKNLMSSSSWHKSLITIIDLCYVLLLFKTSMNVEQALMIVILKHIATTAWDHSPAHAKQASLETEIIAKVTLYTNSDDVFKIFIFLRSCNFIF